MMMVGQNRESYHSSLCIMPINLTVAVVSLTKTLYQAGKRDGRVEICASVQSPVIDCPIGFPFNVTLSTTNGTAGT